jgi:hypothetical protein
MIFRDILMARTKTLLILACVFLVGCEDRTEITEDEITKSLPPGTSAAEVESYLNKMKCGFVYDKETKKYTAVMRDVSSSVFVSQRLLIIIRMDENDKLKNLDFLVYYKDL